MGRILLQVVLPFLFPFIAFFGYRWLVERRRAWLAEGPWLWLALIGVVLSGAGLLWMALEGGAPAGSDYIPPRVEDGRLLPGEFRDPAAE
jgi:hypothetical protein